jgi:hypothetical protein
MFDLDDGQVIWSLILKYHFSASSDLLGYNSSRPHNSPGARNNYASLERASCSFVPGDSKKIKMRKLELPFCIEFHYSYSHFSWALLEKGHIALTALRIKSWELRHLPSSIIAVVTFLPVTPWAQAASTFKSSRGLPPFCPVFFCWRRYNYSVNNLISGLTGSTRLGYTV